MDLGYVVEILLDREIARQRIMGRRLCENDNNHPNNIYFDAIKPDGDNAGYAAELFQQEQMIRMPKQSTKDTVSTMMQKQEHLLQLIILKMLRLKLALNISKLQVKKSVKEFQKCFLQNSVNSPVYLDIKKLQSFCCSFFYFSL